MSSSTGRASLVPYCVCVLILPGRAVYAAANVLYGVAHAPRHVSNGVSYAAAHVAHGIACITHHVPTVPAQVLALSLIHI